MNITKDRKTNIVEVTFKIRSNKFTDSISGLDTYLGKKQDKNITITYKKKVKSNKTFYRIKLIGKEEKVIETIKVFDNIIQVKDINWMGVIEKIKNGEY